MSTPAETSRIGDLVGAKYRLVRFMAEGGMGVVYEAQHTVVRRRFAVKLLRADLAKRRDILTRFQHEAEAAGALENENVTAALDFGIDDDGTPYIVMEYLVGESLASLLERERRLAPGRATDICLQASRGVHAAHALGIVHRDLKPHNLFVCRREDGTDLLKVLDFGVAKLQALDELNAATRTGTVLGTASYMSPEQARGDRAIDHRADVYALGAILYELLSGKRPHPGDSHNAILHHISTQPVVPLGSVQAGLPEALVQAVEYALASDPNARPASAEAFGQSIALFARREVWPAASSGDSGRVRADVSSTLLAPNARPAGNDSSLIAATVDDRRPAAPSHRRPRVAWLLGASAAVAALVVAIGISRRAQGPPRPAATSAAPAGRDNTLRPDTRFVAPPPDKRAVQEVGSVAVTRPESAQSATAVTRAEAPSPPRSVRRRPARASEPRDRPTPESARAGSSAPPPAPVTFDPDNPYK